MSFFLSSGRHVPSPDVYDRIGVREVFERQALFGGKSRSVSFVRGESGELGSAVFVSRDAASDLCRLFAKATEGSGGIRLPRGIRVSLDLELTPVRRSVSYDEAEQKASKNVQTSLRSHIEAETKVSGGVMSIVYSPRHASPEGAGIAENARRAIASLIMGPNSQAGGFALSQSRSVFISMVLKKLGISQPSRITNAQDDHAASLIVETLERIEKEINGGGRRGGKTLSTPKDMQSAVRFWAGKHLAKTSDSTQKEIEIKDDSSLSVIAKEIESVSFQAKPHGIVVGGNIYSIFFDVQSVLERPDGERKDILTAVLDGEMPPGVIHWSMAHEVVQRASTLQTLFPSAAPQAEQSEEAAGLNLPGSVGVDVTVTSACFEAQVPVDALSRKGTHYEDAQCRSIAESIRRRLIDKAYVISLPMEALALEMKTACFPALSGPHVQYDPGLDEFGGRVIYTSVRLGER